MKKLALLLAVSLSFCGYMAVSATIDEREKQGRELVRSNEIVYLTCGERHLGLFRFLYGDLDGTEQRKIADTWATRCPKLVDYNLETPK